MSELRNHLTPESRILKRFDVDPSDIAADRNQLAAVVDDLRRCGGIYAPRAGWMTFDCALDPVEDGRPYLDKSFSDEAVENHMATMEKLLEPWIGAQRKRAGADVVSRYAPYLMAHDPLGLWTANVASPDVLPRLIQADLGSILDLNIMYSFSTGSAGPRSAVLEIGGGYGRLAEAALNVFGEAVRYVLVDSVPGSILYARDYLRKACPWARIGYYYDGDPFDMERFNCYIVPSWHFESVNNTDYDICINVESFQEMGQAQVDAYLAWFDNFTRDNGLIYLSNARDYQFKGDWNYPVTWRRLLCTRTPRSWTPDHRTEAFVKGSRDYSAPNAAIMAAYHWQVARKRQLLPTPLDVAKWLSGSPKSNARALLPRARALVMNRSGTWAGRRV
jgi:hypothetical protein